MRDENDDANSNRLSIRDPNNVGEDCIFDARNRETSCTDTAGDTTQKFYDAHNNVVVRRDAFGNDTVCEFDARDRKVSCTDRINGTRLYFYDGNSNLTAVTDAEGNSTLYAYEARNLRIRETYPDNGERQYTYDAANRLSSRLDQANDLTQYVYDMANRLTQRLYPDALNDLFGYDRANRLVSAASQRYANTVTRAYDNAGRLISETLAVAADGDGGPFSATIAYDYDAANRQTQVSYPDGSVVSRAFSARNQLAQVNYQANLVASLAYDVGRRRVTTTFGNGRVETRTYRPDNLPTTQKTPGVTDFTYSWDANKRKTQELDAAIPQNAQDYAYDAEDRLVDFARANGDAQTWNLTLEGDWAATIINGLTENRTHNAVHELIQRNGTTLTYDAKGNLTSNPARGHTYAWDYENRLISASSALSVVETSYDALGRRVSKTDGAATTIFVSAGLQEIAEYTNNALTKKYVYGVYIDEPLLMINVAGLVETKYYYHANNLYSVAAITDATGAVVERYRYTPYGEATVLDPTGLIPQPSSLVSQPYFFTGRRLDAETDLMYYRARYYDVQLGRFLSRDPLEYVDGMNLYQYAKSDPVGMLDADGLASVPGMITEWLLKELAEWGIEEILKSKLLKQITKVTEKGPTSCPPLQERVLATARWEIHDEVGKGTALGFLTKTWEVPRVSQIDLAFICCPTDSIPHWVGNLTSVEDYPPHYVSTAPGGFKVTIHLRLTIRLKWRLAFGPAI